MLYIIVLKPENTLHILHKLNSIMSVLELVNLNQTFRKILHVYFFRIVTSCFFIFFFIFYNCSCL